MRALFAAALILFSSPVMALDKGLEIPARPSAPVTDEVGLLDSSEQSTLNQWLREIRTKAGVEIAVYIPNSLQDRDIADFSMAVAERWGLGQKKADKGFLFVVAPKERKMRFEVGYGLEGDITDAYSRRVLDDRVKPYFSAGKYAEGIAAGIAAVAEKVGVDPSLAEKGEPQGAAGIPGWALFLLLFLIFGAGTFLRSLFGVYGYYPRGRGRGPWGGGWGGGSFGGGSFGGGSWGGGGGGFGGGGASSSW